MAGKVEVSEKRACPVQFNADWKIAAIARAKGEISMLFDLRVPVKIVGLPFFRIRTSPTARSLVRAVEVEALSPTRMVARFPAAFGVGKLVPARFWFDTKIHGFNSILIVGAKKDAAYPDVAFWAEFLVV